jgi:LmbE family N-acetylglucosaminyl deacetylase
VTRALFVSPHLDDVAFSCGGILAAWAGAGRHCVLLTCFTASASAPSAFALACQTDKGIAPDVDYMALRRAEDVRAAAVLGADEVVHLPFHEAPHRGYGSAPALFGRARRDDQTWRDLRGALAPHVAQADVVLLPQGLGNHIDHRQVRQALAGLTAPETWAYRDTPYALREPGAAPPPEERGERIDLERKLDACAAYASQLGFQFGGAAQMRDALRAFALAEGRRLCIDGPAEALAPAHGRQPLL